MDTEPPAPTNAATGEAQQPIDDPHAHLHDDAALFAPHPGEMWEPIGEPIKLVDAGAEAGVTIAAQATSVGTVAIRTVVTVNDAGEPLAEPTSTTLQLHPAVLIQLASMVPPEMLDAHAGGGADVIQLHPGPVMNDVVIVENGITNAPCQATGCERRIQLDQETGEWDHLPDALGLKPSHPAVPPTQDVLDVVTAPAAGDQANAVID